MTVVVGENGEQVDYWIWSEKRGEKWVVKCNWRGGRTGGLWSERGRTDELLNVVGEEGGQVGCWIFETIDSCNRRLERTGGLLNGIGEKGGQVGC